MARSDLGILDLNEKRWNQLFRVDGVKLSSGSLKDKIKIFNDKKGDQPMKIDVKFKDINVILGQYDVDMILEYTMMVSFGLDPTAVAVTPASTTPTNPAENPFGGALNQTGTLVDPDPESIPADIEPQEWLYDEFKMTTSMNINAENEVLHIDLKEHKVVVDAQYGQRDFPRRNSLGMTSNEYREFLSDFSLTMSEFKKWLQDVVLRGDRVTFPYNFREFDTTLKFSKKQLHVMIDVGDEAATFLEH